MRLGSPSRTYPRRRPDSTNPDEDGPDSGPADDAPFSDTPGSDDDVADPPDTATEDTTATPDTGTFDSTDPPDAGDPEDTQPPEPPALWLLSIDNSPHVLQRIDLATGGSTDLCTLDSTSSYPSLTFSRSNLLFASKGGTALDVIDPCTCQVSALGGA